MQKRVRLQINKPAEPLYTFSSLFLTYRPKWWKRSPQPPVRRNIMVYIPLNLMLLFPKEVINTKWIEELWVCHQHGLSFKSFPIIRTMRACARKGLWGYPFHLPQLHGRGLSGSWAAHATSRLASNAPAVNREKPRSLRAPHPATPGSQAPPFPSLRAQEITDRPRSKNVLNPQQHRVKQGGLCLHLSRLGTLDCITQRQWLSSTACATGTEWKRKSNTLYNFHAP